ncbi:MAG: TAXI family TRAP transporter solute-binding subunit [Rhizobiaceae bacterium]|nr:TAXI family TRAP transporter solute-binding subunit [Rhizobiaceae bacterium]
MPGRISNKADPAGKPFPAGANTQGSRLHRYRVWSLFALIIAVLVGSVAYWLYSRDQGPVVLSVGAGPYRSDSHELMKEVADVVARHSDTIRLKVIATSDSSRNISLLNADKVDMATIRSDTPVVNAVRMVADLFPDYFQIITRRDRGIDTVPDLGGKRIAIPRFGTDEFRSFWIVGDHYDLPIEKMDWKVMQFGAASQALLSGKVDALFTVRSLRDRLLINLFEDAELKGIGLDFLSIDQAPAMALKRPFLRVGEVPLGAFAGSSPTPADNTQVPTVERILVTRKDVPDEAVRELTRILFEHRLDLVIRFALASAISEPDAGRGLNVPLHDGAQQYFDRNEPSFLQENAEPLALGVTLFAMLLSGLLALRSRLVSSQKNRMDSYNYVLLEIAQNARQAGSMAEIGSIREQMFDLLESVVKALDTDDVTEEGFQSFSFLWESVREILNERSREIAGESSSKGGKKKATASR